MSEYKFKPGDIVIGNEKASKQYEIIPEGFIGQVLETEEDDFMIKCGNLFFWVDYDCFDLYEHAEDKPSKQKKNKVISLVEENKALKAENEKLNKLIKTYGINEKWLRKISEQVLEKNEILENENIDLKTELHIIKQLDEFLPELENKESFATTMRKELEKHIRELKLDNGNN